MGPQSYMRSVVDRNLVMRRMTVETNDREALNDVLLKLVNIYTTCCNRNCCVFPT